MEGPEGEEEKGEVKVKTGTNGSRDERGKPSQERWWLRMVRVFQLQ
jgi:hypothetical protein